jgi:hypothetical protein
MAYDRYDTSRTRERERGYSGRRDNDRDRDEDRGFFERAGDEIASWFGDDDAERRRRYDEQMNREDHNRSYGRDRGDRERYAIGGWGERDNDRSRQAYGSPARDRDRGTGRNWDLHRSSGGYGDEGQRSRGYGGGSYGGAFTGSDYERRAYSGGSSDRGESRSMRDSDRHYQSWRQRQLDELDRDYEQYVRERQERFESDFGAWRETRMNKRQQLGRIHEHMDVVGSDGETVGKVDCVRGDRIILTRSDSPDDRHHSLDCSMIDTVEGDQVRLDVSAEDAKNRWRDEERGGLFGRDRNREDDVNFQRNLSRTES